MPRWLLLPLLLLCFCLWPNQPVQASIHLYPESTGQMMVRSLQTLRDREDRAWQIVLFKRVNHGQVQDFHLRLVGFPGMVELEHSAPLTLTNSIGKIWTAPDFPVPYASHIGEYDMLAIMNQLDDNAPLTLSLPIKAQPVELPIPPFVVQEWRRLKDSDPNLP